MRFRTLRLLVPLALMPALGTVRAQPVDAPPSTPAGLSARAYSPTAGAIRWQRSTDDRGAVVGYAVARDGEALGTFDALSYVDRALEPGTRYRYTVAAIDNAGQRSAAAEATLLSEGRGPDSGATLDAPAGLRAEVYSRTAAEIFWERPATVGLTYEVRRDGTPLATIGGTSYFDDALAGGTEYRYEVIAIDRTGRRSAAASVSLETAGGRPGPGSAAPAAPTELRVALYSGFAGELFWARPDTPGLTYEVRRNGDPLATTDGTSYFDETLSLGDDYRYEVVAIDEQGRRSPAATITVYRSDPPTPEPRARALSTTSVELTWSATERPGVVYRIERRGQTFTGFPFPVNEEPTTVTVEGTRYVDEGLPPGRRYRYTIVAIDTEGRRSEPGEVIGSTPPEGARFDLETLFSVPAAGFVVDAGPELARPLGDATGDGLTDLLLPFKLDEDDPRNRFFGSESAAYVVPGRTEPYPSVESRSPLDIPGAFTVPPEPFGVNRDAQESETRRYRRAGDFNGDGIADVIGTSYDTSVGPLATVAWVIYGRADLGSVDSVDDIGPGDGVVIDGGAFVERLAGNVTFAGDLNGDGADELLFSARTSTDDDTGANVFVVYGGADVPSRLSLDASTRVERIARVGPNDPPSDSGAGPLSAVGAGDVNGDGVDDLAISGGGRITPQSPPAAITLVLYGRIGSRLEFNSFLDELPAARGYRLTDTRGRPTPVGDLDGDGTEDWVFEDWGGLFGPSLVVLNESGPPPVRSVEDLPEGRTRLVEGELDPVGDTNGDGRADLVVFPERINSSIAGFLLYDTFATSGPITEENLLEQPGVSFTLDETRAGVRTGASGLGDVNGDGFDDLQLTTITFPPGGTSASYQTLVVYGAAELPSVAEGR